MESRKKCYVVTGNHGANARVMNLMAAGGDDFAMTLVSGGARESFTDGRYVIPHRRNVFGVFRRIGLPRLSHRLDRFCYFPGWGRLFVSAAYHALKPRIAADLRCGVEVVLVTILPPHDLCLLGVWLRRDFPEIKWLIDWQDLWSYDESYFQRIHPRFRQRALRLEKEAAALSHCNITTNTRAARKLAELTGADAARIVAINHCFTAQDQAKFQAARASVAPAAPTPARRIGFLGTFFKPPKVPGEKFIRALGELRRRGFAVELHVYGDVSSTAARYREHGAPDGVFFHERTSHETSLERVAECDFLLLLLEDLPNSKVIVHQKLPHYLLLGKPVIAIVPEESAVADIITRTGSGYVIPSAADWVEELRSILTSPPGGQGKRDNAAIMEYEWNNTAAQWTAALRHVFMKGG